MFLSVRWHSSRRNDNRNKYFRIKGTSNSDEQKKVWARSNIRRILSRKFLDGPLAFTAKNFEVISFRMPFRGRRVAVSSACFHRALSREAKDLIMLPGTKVKSLPPQSIRGTFAKKGPRALQHFLPVPSSFFRRPRSPGKLTSAF